MLSPRRHIALLLFACAACGGDETSFTEPQVLGGVEIDAATLNRGRDVYVRTCAACHGDEGDGRGPAAPSLPVPPRDFTKGLFKYAGVPAGALPNDADLLRTLRRGLPGTPMLAWDLTERERRAVVHYIKTFSPEWRSDVPPPAIVPTPDPYRTNVAEGVRRGEALFHVRAKCATCHGAYAGEARLQEMSRALEGRELDLSTRPFERRARESEFYAGDEPVRIVPPDFLEDQMKNGATLDELYRTIAAGVGGTAMPTWRGAIPEEDLWAIVHYTKSLVDRR